MGDLRAFIDTNVILDHLEGKVDLLEIREKIGTLYSNIIVFSEAFMVYLKAITGERAYTLKHNPEIITNKKDELKDLFLMFEMFEHLEINKEVRDIAFRYIVTYGLLPNDAIILATCKFYGIKYLISFDSDFRGACGREGIILIDSKEKLDEIIGSGDSK